MATRDEWLAAVESRIARLEDKATDLAVVRDRLERLERAVDILATNVIEIQALRQEEVADRARILSIIERQARVSETIETQLLAKLDSIGTNAGKAADKAVEIYSHVHSLSNGANGANGTGEHRLSERAEAAPVPTGDKEWIPRAIDALRRLPLRAWVGIILLSAIAAIGWSFYLIEREHNVQSKNLPASEQH